MPYFICTYAYCLYKTCALQNLSTEKKKRAGSCCFLEWNPGITVVDDSDVAQRKARGGIRVPPSLWLVNICILLDYIQKRYALQRRMNLNKVHLMQVLSLGSTEYKTEPVFQGTGHFF